jgi:hypothetical protein
MDFETGDSLLRDVYDEAGFQYGQVVRRCIYCEFDLRKKSFEDAQFRRMVYENVVYPLEEDLKIFLGE